LELTRYIVLNPLRAKMVERLKDWPWSSYRAMIGKANVPDWLDKDWLPSPLDQTQHQLLLGDDAFAEQFRQNKKPEEFREVSKSHRRSFRRSLYDSEPSCAAIRTK